MQDLRLIYHVVSMKQAEVELGNLELKWGKDYPIRITTASRLSPLRGLSR